MHVPKYHLVRALPLARASAEVVISPPALVLLPVSLSKCSGFTRVGEDSSETAFLLVENYNYDCFNWTSVRLGIFYTFASCAFH
jgi:hypothetical protein